MIFTTSLRVSSQLHKYLTPITMSTFHKRLLAKIELKNYF